VDEAQNPALAEMIAATWQQASESIAKIHDGRKNAKLK
jgi:hypothetical protein